VSQVPFYRKEEENSIDIKEAEEPMSGKLEGGEIGGWSVGNFLKI